jgi:hypothetical protein
MSPASTDGVDGADVACGRTRGGGGRRRLCLPLTLRGVDRPRRSATRSSAPVSWVIEVSWGRRQAGFHWAERLAARPGRVSRKHRFIRDVSQFGTILV